MILAALALAVAQEPAAPAAEPSQQAPTAPQPFFSPRRRALVVGASDYEHLGRLRYAAGDAERFAAALRDRLGFEEDAVRLLTDATADPRLTPTAGHVIGELEALLADKRGAETDLFVFYFSGHGVGLPEGDYLMPTDARRESALRVGLPVREIVDRLAAAAMKNVLVIVDACREGEANPFGAELRRLGDAARLAVILGCEPGQRSYEDARLGGGIFTAMLLRALEDEELRDPISGALWASRVAGAAAERVRERTGSREPVQRPFVWTDATRDILLEARPSSDAAAFLAQAGRLDPEGFVAAAGDYALLLHLNGWFDEAIEVLKAAEQIRPLPAEHAQVLASALAAAGRSVEAARVLRGIRDSEPGSLQALIATVIDVSGAVEPDDRAAAAAALWDSGERLPLDLIVLMVNAHLQGGSGADASKLASEVLVQTPRGTRQRAYLSGVIAALEPGSGDPVEMLGVAERLPGAYPTIDQIRLERVQFAASFHGTAEALALLDEAVSLWPDDGRWYAQRAWMRRQVAATIEDLDPVAGDVEAALERPLDPPHLWLLARAAGGRAPEYAEGFRAQAAAHPLAWQAQLAAVFATQPEDLRGAVAAAARLAARPALAYAAMARITHDGVLEQVARAASGLAPDDPTRAAAEDALVEVQTQLYERLTPMAADFGGEAEAWALLQDLSERILAYEPFARLLARHAGERVEQARLSAGMARVAFRAFANTGRYSLLPQVRRSIAPKSLLADSMLWQEATVLACAGRDAEARTLLDGRKRPQAQSLAGMAAELRLLLALRAGEPEAPDALRAAGPPPPEFLLRALRTLSLRAAGEHETAEALTDWAEEQNPGAAFFAAVAVLAARPGADPSYEALRAASLQAGNPLTAAPSFVGAGGLAELAGAYAFRIAGLPQVGEGDLAALDALLQFTVLPDGKVLGALMLPAGEALVVQGAVDARGNLEAAAQRGAGATAERFTLLMKLAPPPVQREYAPLRESGQRIDVLRQDGLLRRWAARFEG